MFFPCGIQISYFLPVFYFSQPAFSVSFRHIGPKFSLFLEKNKTEYLPNTIFIGELQIYLNIEDKIINVVEKNVEKYLCYLGCEGLTEQKRHIKSITIKQKKCINITISKVRISV